MSTTRRSALRRGLLLLAGAAGVGAGAKAAGLAVGVDALVVYAPVAAGAAQPLPVRGERRTLVTELFDRPGGTSVGSLYGAGFLLHGPAAAAATGVHGLELHTFALAEGTIVGSGTAGEHEGVFAVLGGTGRWSGARGSYSTRRLETPAGPAAEFRFALTT